MDFVHFVLVAHGMHFADFAHEILGFQRKSRISRTNPKFFDEIAHIAQGSEVGPDRGSDRGSDLGSDLGSDREIPWNSMDPMEVHGIPWPYSGRL